MKCRKSSYTPKTGCLINHYHVILMPVFSYFVKATTAQFASSQVTTKHQRKAMQFLFDSYLYRFTNGS